MNYENREAFATLSVSELRAAAISLAKAAAALEQLLSPNTAAAGSAAPAPEQAAAEPAAPVKTPAQARALLAADMGRVVALGRVPEAKAAIAQLGATKLSDITDDRLEEAAALIAEVLRG
jgi:hypothetical protein